MVDVVDVVDVPVQVNVRMKDAKDQMRCPWFRSHDSHAHRQVQYSVQVTNKIKFSDPELVWAALRSIIPSLCGLKRALALA